jgi:short-subunit dehydrogenase
LRTRSLPRTSARREGPLTGLAEELHTEHGVDCIIISVDLYSADAFNDISSAVGSREVGLFISNAGGDPHSSRFLDLDVDDWINQINRNITTVVHCCHHFGGQMRERKRGGILLVGSGSCYGGASFMAVYSGTKAFDLSFGEGLWAELKPHGVDVLNLILGRTDTPALRKVLETKNLPVPQGLASPVDVAKTGLAQLPHGPVHNWGQKEDEVGFSPISAAARRARILAIDESTKDIFGKD